MKAAKELRRMGIMLKKRLSLFKYNFQLKKSMGMYDLEQEVNLIESQKRSLNLYDFTSNRSDFYLLDEFSDASDFGGQSEMTLA